MIVVPVYLHIDVYVSEYIQVIYGQIEFDKPFISKVVPLKQFVNTSTIEKQDIFYLVVNLNAMERCALDVID